MQLFALFMYICSLQSPDTIAPFVSQIIFIYSCKFIENISEMVFPFLGGIAEIAFRSYWLPLSFVLFKLSYKGLVSTRNRGAYQGIMFA